MPRTKISQMPAATALTGAELVPIVQSGVNKKVTVETLRGEGTGGGAATDYESINLTATNQVLDVSDNNIVIRIGNAATPSQLGSDRTLTIPSAEDMAGKILYISRSGSTSYGTTRIAPEDGNIELTDGTQEVTTGDMTPLSYWIFYADADNNIWRLISVSKLAPYRSYVAHLTQSGTNAPVAAILENTLGYVPVWSYMSVGSYHLTLPDEEANSVSIVGAQQYDFVSSVRGFNIVNNGSGSGDLIIEVQHYNITDISTPVSVNDFDFPPLVEIRIYN